MRDVDAYDNADSWRSTVGQQHGIVSRGQALEHGFTDDGILAQLRGGRWVRVGRGALATVTGPPTNHARCHAALLSAGAPAAISHRTAGRIWGMIAGEWPADEPCHVTVPYGRSAMSTDDLLVHRSRAFEHIAVEHLGLVVIGPAQTAVDLAVAEPDAPSAMRMLCHLALAGRVRVEALATAMELRRPRRYRRACAAAVDLLRGGVRSELELGYALDVQDAHGLPAPDRQVPMFVDGSRVFEDCLYRCPAGEVIVRLDGHRHHADRATRLRDRRRGNAAELTGRGRLEFGWEEVTGTPCLVAREVAASLALHGWLGVMRRCTRCM